MDDQTEMALPDDALANILRRLPPRYLASSRRVCKAWRAVVDDRGLLLPLARLLPLSVRGVFVNYIDSRSTRLFARPSSTRPVLGHGDLDFLPDYSRSFNSVKDHCNGLLLYADMLEFCVANPATRRWERLPPRTTMETDVVRDHVAYLVFDPAVSPHYEVFLFRREPWKPRPFDLVEFLSSLDDDDVLMTSGDTAQSSPQQQFSVDEDVDPFSLMEWPPSRWTLPVFSSATREWQEKPFLRDGDAIATMADVVSDSLMGLTSGSRWRYGVYWRGALYVHCRGGFVTRFSLSDGKYQVIEIPIAVEECKPTRPYLGRLEKGVCFAAHAIHDGYKLQIWNLNESSGQLEWVLKHHIDLGSSALRAAIHSTYNDETDGPWIVDGDDNDDDGNKMVIPGENFEWDSDDDNVLDTEDGHGDHYSSICFLGFHPYKEVVFLDLSFRGLAYHLNGSKVQYLGKLRPRDYYRSFEWHLRILSIYPLHARGACGRCFREPVPKITRAHVLVLQTVQWQDELCLLN